MKRSTRTRQRRQQDGGDIRRLLVASIMICLLGLARSVPLADVEPTTDAEVDVGLGATPELNDASDDGDVAAASSTIMAEPATGAKAAPKALAVCQGEPANALHPAPDDCRSFITCDGQGSGHRTLCAAGTGYSSDKRSCLPLTAGPEGATAAGCMFAAPAAADDADAQVQASSSSAADTEGVISLTCSEALLQDKAVTATNLAVVAGSPEFGGAARCALANLGRQGRLVFQIDPADQRVISTLTISYYQRGQGSNMLQVISAGATAGARKNTKQVLSSLVPAAAGGGASAAAAGDDDGDVPLAAQPWVRGIQRISLPGLPTSVGVVLLQQDRDVAEVQLVSVTLTTTTTPPTNVGPVPADATVASAAAAAASGPDDTKQQAADGTWVAPTPEEVQSYAASTLLDGAKPSGRKLLQTELNWLVSLPTSDPDLLGGNTDQSLLETFLGSWQRINTPSQCYRPTYGRGVGEPVSACGNGQEKQAGLCYDLCKPGYTGVGPVCWEQCPSGYRDDGVTCYKGGDTSKASGKCPGYDLCGLWKKNRNCKTCPPDYRRDGCLCTRYPKWHTKDTYTRASHMPGCGGSKPNYDAGLCYPDCALGYSGVGPVCWANCADSEPVYCGASKPSSAICSRDQQACNDFIAKVITQVVSLVVEVVKAVAEVVESAGTLSAAAVMGIIKSGAALATTFAETPMCDKVAQLHLPSGLTLLQFDRDFAGFDVASLQSPSYSDCMVQCANNPTCEFAVYGAKWQACWLKRSPGLGPNGVNVYNPELKTGVAIQRVKTDRANFQWAKASDADLAGSLIPVGGSDGGFGITHSNVPGQRNLALCAVTCMTLQGCTHVVYTDTTCFFKNANGAPQTTPATGGQIRGTLANMSVLNFDKK